MKPAGNVERFLCFAGIGVVATSIQYLILVAGVHLAHAAPVVASSIGFFIAALVNYALNRRYTFGSRKPHVEAVTKFATVAAIGLALNGMLLAAGTQILGLNYLLAQVLATLAVLIWNYSANASWTFAAR
jgi:putative flippase GtrA